MLRFWMLGRLIGLSLGILVVLSFPVRGHDGLHEQIIAVTKKIKSSPKDPALYLKRAELYRLHAEWKKSEADFNHVERLDPDLTIVNLGRGKLWLDSNRFSKARASLTRYLSIQPDSFEGVITMARVLTKLKETDNAAKHFTRAIGLAPKDSVEIYLERADALRVAGQIDEALNGLDEGIGKLGGIVTLQMAAIDLEVKRGRHDLALVRLEKLMESMPRKETFLLRRGEILLQAGKPCEARDSLIASQSSFETLPPARRNVRAVRTQITRLRSLLDSLPVKNCPA